MKLSYLLFVTESDTSKCFGFSDETARPIARPKHLRECFSGHKRHHCSKWQAIVLSYGVTCSSNGGHRESPHISLLLACRRGIGTLEAKIASFEKPHNLYLRRLWLRSRDYNQETFFKSRRAGRML